MSKFNSLFPDDKESAIYLRCEFLSLEDFLENFFLSLLLTIISVKFRFGFSYFNF